MNNDGSSILGVSIRAWIACLLVSTVCLIYTLDAFATVWLNFHGANLELKISEPLYTLAIMAVSFYLGNKANQSPTSSDGNTTTPK